jgi:hypothetical protein
MNEGLFLCRAHEETHFSKQLTAKSILSLKKSPSKIALAASDLDPAPLIICLILSLYILL